MGIKNPRLSNAVYEMRTEASGEQMLTVDATAGGVQLVSASFPEDTRVVQIQCQAQTVRMTLDGSAPVATSHGELLYPGDRVLMSKEEATAAKFIREGGTSGTIHARCKSY